MIIFANNVVSDNREIINTNSAIFTDKYGSVGLISLNRGRNSLGGSFVADTYYNFGYFGVLVCLLYGILVVRVLKKYNIRKTM